MRTQIQRTTGGGHRQAPRALGGVVALGLLTGTFVAAAPLAQAAPVTVGNRTFDVQSATVGQDHYQAAYSARNNVVWVTATTHNWDGGAPRADVSTISKLNPATLQVISTITPRTLDAGTATARPEAAYGIAVDDENNRIWTSATREDAVVVYNQDTGARVAIIGNTGHSRDIAIDPYRDIAYVSDPNGGQITKIDTKTLQVVETIRGLTSGFSPMSLDLVADENTALLYTVNLNDGALIELDSLKKDFRVVANTGGTRASGVAVDRGRGLAYVSSQDSADVRTVNLSTGAVINTVRGSAGLLNSAVDAEAGLVYSTVFYGSSVLDHGRHHGGFRGRSAGRRLAEPCDRRRRFRLGRRPRCRWVQGVEDHPAIRKPDADPHAHANPDAHADSDGRHRRGGRRPRGGWDDHPARHRLEDPGRHQRLSDRHQAR